LRSTGDGDATLPGAAPWQPALQRDDVAVPDLRKLARVVRSAVHQGDVLPRRHKRLWVTEISWDSSPPDRLGVPAPRQAQWLAGGFDARRHAGRRHDHQV
jgi:hypothetical protein